MRPQIQSRLSDVKVLEAGAASNEGSDLGNGPVTVSLTLSNGSVVSKTITPSPGSPADPITQEQMEQKWIDCMRVGRPQLGDASARSLFPEGNRIDGSVQVSQSLAVVCDRGLRVLGKRPDPL